MACRRESHEPFKKIVKVPDVLVRGVVLTSPER
jgi:hypothetical protein